MVDIAITLSIMLRGEIADMFKRLLGAACLLSLSSCTIVRIEGAQRATLLRFGVVKIEPEPDAEMIAYKSRGFGLVPSLNGATLGFGGEDAALLFSKSACRVVIFELPKEASEASKWKDFFDERHDICLVGGNK